MTDTNELRALLERATKGEWETQDPLGSDAGDGLWIVQAGLKPHEWNPLAIVYSDDVDEPEHRIGVLERDANAALFANVKKIAAALLASAERVAALEAALRKIGDATDDVCRQIDAATYFRDTARAALESARS